MNALLHLIVLATFSVAAQGAEPAETEVIVIPSMHGAHKNHGTYDYEVLFSLVNSLEADFVGVEIRPEDIGRDRTYLSANYPYEMTELAGRYPGRVFGVDWLGSTIVGESIPEGYFANLNVLKLSAALNDDEVQNTSKPGEIAVLENRQSHLIEQATPAALADGRYGEMSREIDRLERAWLSGTIYEDLLDFNQQRDAEIGGNIIAFMERNRGSRVVFTSTYWRHS
jgi:hypothetical protein